MPWMMRWAGRLPARRRASARARASTDSTATSTSISASATPARWPATPRRRSSRRVAGARLERGTTTMLPTEDAAVGRRGARAALRPAALAVHAHRHRRQPHGAPHRPPDHRPPEGPRLLLLLPRRGRRGVRRRRAPAARPRAGGQRRRRRSTVAETTRVGRVQRRRRRSRRRSPHGDVACVLAEPAMTNIGIVLPDPGYHDGAAPAHARRRDAADRSTRRTRSRPGPGGAPRAWGLEPDLVTIGKAIAGGVPIGAYGLSGERRRADARRRATPTSRTSAASAARWPATRCRWPPRGRRSSDVLTDEAFARMIAARRPASPTASRRHRDHAGCRGTSPSWAARAEYRFAPAPPRNGAEAAAAADAELERLPAPLPAQPRRADHAVPQHGADVPGTTTEATSTATPRCSPTRSTRCCRSEQLRAPRRPAARHPGQHYAALVAPDRDLFANFERMRREIDELFGDVLCASRAARPRLHARGRRLLRAPIRRARWSGRPRRRRPRARSPSRSAGASS